MKYKQNNDIEIDNNFLENFFKNRGIQDLEHFLNPRKEDLIDYLLLDNIVTAANRLLFHIENNHKIFLIVDSDTDGFCSAAEIYLYIKHINPNIEIEYFIHEGKQHGLEDVYDKIPDDIQLVLIPDAGSNDYIYHNFLKQKGKEIIVLDHHESDQGYSKDAIVVNNQLSEKYRNKSLCGAAVVYKFCCCLDDLLNDNYSNNLIDFAAVALIGDMMLLTDLETRYILEQGLNNIKNIGIESFIEKQSYSMNNQITPIGIAFYVVPLINALIRVGTQEEKKILFRAFIEPNVQVPSTKRGHKEGDMETTAGQAVRFCTNAKNRQDKQKIKSFEMLDLKIQKEGLDEHKIIVVQVKPEEEFDNSLTGLVAMQLVSKYKKPVCVVRENSDGFLKGSARGIANTDMGSMRDFLNESGLFEYNAGHSFAFGTSIHKNNLDKFLKYADEKLKEVDFNENVYDVDLIIEGDNEFLPAIICQFGELNNIWGQGMEEPLILIKNIKLNSNNIQLIGNDKTTIKFDYNGVTYIKFKDKDFGEELKKNNTMEINILGRANLNNYMGKITPQIFINDYEIIDTTYLF